MKRYIESHGVKLRLRCEAKRSVIVENYTAQCQKLSGHLGKHGSNLDGSARRKWMVTWKEGTR